MPANAYLESIQRLGDSQLHPYLESLSGTQSQPDSQRAAMLSALVGNTTTTTRQRQPLSYSYRGSNIKVEGAMMRAKIPGINRHAEKLSSRPALNITKHW
jgi:hypothetical protein